MSDLAAILQNEGVIARFWSKVEKGAPDQCWLWQGRLNADGYGLLSFGKNDKPRAHRIALALVNPPADPRACACHSCDNRRCVNPSHLWWGSHGQNMVDASEKGRWPNTQKTQCVHGHPFTPENTMARMCRGRPSRECRECRRIHRAKWKKKAREQARSLRDQNLSDKPPHSAAGHGSARSTPGVVGPQETEGQQS